MSKPRDLRKSDRFRGFWAPIGRNIEHLRERAFVGTRVSAKFGRATRNDLTTAADGGVTMMWNANPSHPGRRSTMRHTATTPEVGCSP